MRVIIHFSFSLLFLAGITSSGSPLHAADPDQAEHLFGFERDNMVEIVSRREAGEDGGHRLVFDLSRTEIPAGWTTLKQVNETAVLHFVYMFRLPDDQADLTVEEYAELTPKAFQDAWDPFFAGEIDVNEFFGNLGAGLPEWWGEVVPSGGPGFLDAARTGWTTQYLEPGSYILECYVMDGSGTFHNEHGMLAKLVVTDDPGDAPEPSADLALSISSTSGIVTETEDIQPGLHTVSVTFEDNIVYGHGIGHDVHLIRLDDATSVEDVNTWINYLDVAEDGFYADRGALVSTFQDPGPRAFLGGVDTLFANEAAGETYPLTAYMHVNLTPGRYAWVAEVPNPMQPDPENPDMTMLVEFDVASHADLAGAWYEPDSAGQGWNFLATADGLFGYFYGAGDNGEPLWLVTEAGASGFARGETVAYDLLYSPSGSFNAPTDPESFEYWGELLLTFDSCSEATADISGIHGTQTQALERLTNPPGSGRCGF
ncbi:hypothetical protein [Wenzhouxiangella sp. EGI_FJ10409]|uniref:hypothetical protein n=1 Tax=Wenzhouxiangella sp. EGI_FJ10409 TaxID=3243767 RepID=UPI0035D7EE26